MGMSIIIFNGEITKEEVDLIVKELNERIGLDLMPSIREVSHSRPDLGYSRSVEMDVSHPETNEHLEVSFRSDYTTVGVTMPNALKWGYLDSVFCQILLDHGLKSKEPLRLPHWKYERWQGYEWWVKVSGKKQNILGRLLSRVFRI